MGPTLSPPQATRRGLNLTGRGISNFPRPPVRRRGEQHRLWPALSVRPALAGTAGDHSIGWHFSVGYHTAFPWLGRRINRAGFNVAAWVAPCDFQRRPRPMFEENCLEFARVMAQNVAEIRSAVGWLLDEGCPSVGLLGFSLGDGLRD